MILTALKRLSPRRELRYALLAAAETCWLYAILAFITTVAGSAHTPSPLALFAGYWLALVVGRLLPHIKQPWFVLQAFAVAIALFTLLAIVRLEIYSTFGALDFTWLARYAGALFTLGGDFGTALPTTLGIIYVFIRGIGLGQRPLTLWFTGLQFRLGIVAFFFLFLTAGWFHRYEAPIWVFTYFLISLLAIALARIEETTGNVPVGPRWVVTLLAAVALVLFLGLGLVQVFTLDAADALVGLLMPVGVVVGSLFLIVLIPLSIIVNWLFELVRPLFDNFKGLSNLLAGLVPPGSQDYLKNLQQANPLLAQLIPIFKVVLVLAVVVLVGYWIARALNRRMSEIETEEYIRESIEGDGRAVRKSTRRAAKPHPHRRASIHADSIRRVYAALIARAEQAGLARRIAETPYEFLPRLKHAFPDAAEPISTITEAYIAVHYAEYDAPPEQVHRVREAWKLTEANIRQQAHNQSKRASRKEE